MSHNYVRTSEFFYYEQHALVLATKQKNKLERKSVATVNHMDFLIKMFENKNYELWQGNCLEIMKKLPDKSVDLILCDLPYGVTKKRV